MPLSYWLDHFLDSRAEIHQIFALFFWKIEDTKYILRLTDLYRWRKIFFDLQKSCVDQVAILPGAWETAFGSHSCQSARVSDSGRKLCQNWLLRSLQPTFYALLTAPENKSNRLNIYKKGEPLIFFIINKQYGNYLFICQAPGQNGIWMKFLV